jgi:hypothetical protein
MAGCKAGCAIAVFIEHLIQLLEKLPGNKKVQF